MKWVTREHPHTDRIACPWLIKKFIEPAAEIVYVARDEVLPYAEREGATSFDAPGATWTAEGLAETLGSHFSERDPSRTFRADAFAKL